MNKTLVLFILCFWINTNLIHSQITITDIEKTTEEEVVLKPASYDSINDWTFHSFRENYKVSEYKKYIGLQIYLPTKSKFDKDKSYFQSGQNFLFSPKLAKIKMDGIDYDSLATFIYKPIYYSYETSGVYNPSTNNYSWKKIGIQSDATETNNTYYTILDVIYGKKLDSINDFMYKSLLDLYDKQAKTRVFVLSPNDELLNERPSYIFLLKNNKTGDLLYCFREIENFVLVPYFVKQKSLCEGVDFIYDKDYTISKIDPRYIVKYENEKGYEENKEKKVNIEPLSKWSCSAVTLLKPSYEIHYILNNTKGDQIALENLDDFIDSESYNKRVSEKKLQYQQLATKKKQEELLIKEKEKKSIEKHRLESISLFGLQTGELIAQGKVKLNMTKEMCKYSWGTPYSINKTTTESGVFEDWYYWYGYSLHFTNGLLKRIEQ